MESAERREVMAQLPARMADAGLVRPETAIGSRTN